MWRSRTPSLELSWLPLSDRKTMPTPEVVFLDMPWCSACYKPRGFASDELEATVARDVLFISTHWGKDIRPSTFAHEYRHMQQYYIPALPKIMFDVHQLDFGDTYDTWARALRTFYRTRPWERDALRYERTFSSDEENEQAWQVAFGN